MNHRGFTSLLAFLFLGGYFAYSQDLPTPEKLGYQPFVLSTETLGEVHYYVHHDDKDRDKPLLIYLDGSGPYPLFQKTSRGIGSTVPLASPEYYKLFNILLISKPGVPFVDKVEMNPGEPPDYPAPKEYEQRLSLEWRVESAIKALDDLTTQHGFTPRHVVVLGISEGFQVGANLAARDPRITHVGLFVGNGLNQFYDFILSARRKEDRGEVSSEEAQMEVQSILDAAAEIYANPEAVDKHWMGHTYKRWSSFCNRDPFAELAKLDRT